MSDPYASVSVHGVMPLCRDSETGQLRFAVAGADPVDACISELAALPDAELTLMVFADGSQRAAWMAGAHEFMGNTVEIITPAQEMPCALVIRHDRRRAAGNHVNDVIALRAALDADVATLARKAAAARSAVLDQATRASNRERWRESWKDELAFAAAAKISLGHQAYSSDLEAGHPLHLELPIEGWFVGLFVDLARSEHGLTASHSETRPLLDPDLAEERAQVIARLGFRQSGSDLLLDGKQLDAEFVERIRSAHNDLDLATDDLNRRQKARSAVRTCMEDQRILPILKRLDRGALIAVYRLGDPGAQINPSTGTAGTVPGVHIYTAFSRGLLEIVHPGNDTGQAHLEGRRRLAPPMFLTLSTTGRDIVEGRLEEAAQTILSATDRAKSTLVRDLKGGDLTDSLAAAMSGLNVDTDSLSAALRAKATDSFVKTASRGSSSEHGWAILGPSIGMGLLQLENDVVTTVDAAPAPLPHG